jgi:hypothetical protein
MSAMAWFASLPVGACFSQSVAVQKCELRFSGTADTCFHVTQPGKQAILLCFPLRFAVFSPALLLSSSYAGVGNAAALACS